MRESLRNPGQDMLNPTSPDSSEEEIDLFHKNDTAFFVVHTGKTVTSGIPEGFKSTNLGFRDFVEPLLVNGREERGSVSFVFDPSKIQLRHFFGRKDEMAHIRNAIIESDILDTEGWTMLPSTNTNNISLFRPRPPKGSPQRGRPLKTSPKN